MVLSLEASTDPGHGGHEGIPRLFIPYRTELYWISDRASSVSDCGTAGYVVTVRRVP